MGFHQTPARRLLLIRGCGFLVIAGAIAALPLLVPIDPPGWTVMIVVISIFALRGALDLWDFRRTPSDTIVSRVSNDSPIPVQIQYYRRALWATVLGIPAVSLWTAYDLHQLEIGAVKEARIFVPANILYQHFGFWPGVLCFPVLGLVGFVVIRARIRRLEGREAG